MIRRQRQRRSAFTLLEILLVLAILVALGAMIYPTLAGLYGDVRVKAGADEVQGSWTEARAHAIEDGRSYRFAIQPGTGKFRVAPDDDSFWDGSAPPTDPNAAPAFMQEGELPTGILFESSSDLPSSGSSSWSTVVVFDAYGGCNQDVEITIKEDGDDAVPVVVKIRAMTGAISVRHKDTGGR